ncbi:MAG: hypothetical protein Q7T01_01120 [bacterium]|nr:hypothetical protein [bacterium]
MRYRRTWCTPTIFLAFAMVLGASSDVAADEQSTERYPTWKECWECRDVEQEDCAKGKRGSACRKKKRQCDRIEPECYEIEQSIFGPEEGDAAADDTAAQGAIEPEIVPEPELVAPPPVLDGGMSGDAAAAADDAVPGAATVMPFELPRLPAPSSASSVTTGGAPRVPTAPSRWTSGIAFASYGAAGIGIVLVGTGAWQGMEAVAASRAFAAASTQPAAFVARDRGMRAASYANGLLIGGSALAASAATVLLLEYLGVFDSSNADRIAFVPTAHGVQIVGMIPAL